MVNYSNEMLTRSIEVLEQLAISIPLIFGETE
jgi:hypothetical protein